MTAQFCVNSFRRAQESLDSGFFQVWSQRSLNENEEKHKFDQRNFLPGMVLINRSVTRDKNLYFCYSKTLFSDTRAEVLTRK